MDATYWDPALPYPIGTIQSDIQTTQKKVGIRLAIVSRKVPLI